MNGRAAQERVRIAMTEGTCERREAFEDLSLAEIFVSHPLFVSGRVAIFATPRSSRGRATATVRRIGPPEKGVVGETIVRSLKDPQ